MRKMILVRTIILSVASLLLIQISPTSMAVSTTPSPSCTTNCVVTFAYTGDYYSWTVPMGVTDIVIDAFGAQGGKSSCTYNTVASGGLGGRVQARLTTTPGESLFIYVGGQGSSASISSNTSSAGWNGGGKGGYGTGSGYWGSGGGGATDIRTSVGSLSTRILVSGGGGGASCRDPSISENGGAGGDLTGGQSAASTASNGGTQSAGGAANTWSGWGPSQAGSLGVGGNAQATDVTSGQSLISGGGGGGGGYYGGGGGSWIGGGGGSSYIDALRGSFVTHSQGSRPGNGLLTITYADVRPVIVTSTAGSVKIVKKGEGIQLTANVDQAGKVTFYANGKRIAGCIGISTAGGNVTCNWKPTAQGSTSITSSIYQSGVLRSTSPALILGTAKRTGTRS